MTGWKENAVNYEVLEKVRDLKTCLHANGKN